MTGDIYVSLYSGMSRCRPIGIPVPPETITNRLVARLWICGCIWQYIRKQGKRCLSTGFEATSWFSQYKMCVKNIKDKLSAIVPKIALPSLNVIEA